MAKQRNYTWLIPAVLNLLVLAILWDLFQEIRVERAIILTIAALGWPWLMFLVISKMVSHVAASRAKKSGDAEDVDFV